MKDATGTYVADHTIAYSYDDWGRLASQTRGTDVLDYTWAWDNKLAQVDGSNWSGVGRVVDYTYRGDGKRYERNEHDGVPATGDKTEYHYGLGFGVTNETYTGAGMSLVDKTYLGGLAEFAYDGTATEARHYTQDHLGSTRDVFDSGGGLMGSMEFSPHGSVLSNGLPGDMTRAFTGHHLDGLSRQYFAPFRYLDPQTARWLKRDPLGMIDGPNMYAYVGGNPTSGRDPFGLDTFIMNRKLGSNKKASALNPVSHTFIYTTNSRGELLNTYSWGDGGKGKWFKNNRVDKDAAYELIKKYGNGKRLGDSSLDGYIDEAYFVFKSDGEGKRKWRLWNNCKHSSWRLFDSAVELRKQDGGPGAGFWNSLNRLNRSINPMYSLTGVGGGNL